MEINSVIWLARFVEKLARKHNVFFVNKGKGQALVISARDMSVRERRSYAKQKKSLPKRWSICGCRRKRYHGLPQSR